MSFWESVFTPPLPCPSCWARVIPPTARVPKTIANTLRRMIRPPLELTFSPLGNKDVGVGRFVTGPTRIPNRSGRSESPVPGSRLSSRPVLASPAEERADQGRALHALLRRDGFPPQPKRDGWTVAGDGSCGVALPSFCE